MLEYFAILYIISHIILHFWMATEIISQINTLLAGNEYENSKLISLMISLDDARIKAFSDNRQNYKDSRKEISNFLTLFEDESEFIKTCSNVSKEYSQFPEFSNLFDFISKNAEDIRTVVNRIDKLIDINDDVISWHQEEKNILETENFTSGPSDKFVAHEKKLEPLKRKLALGIYLSQTSIKRLEKIKIWVYEIQTLEQNPDKIYQNCPEFSMR